MRRVGPPSEVWRLTAPLARLLDAAWRRMHWWIAVMAVLYLGSGITVVKPDEVAVILRWGRLVGDTAGLQEHASGLLFAFPRPMDSVIRIPVKHVYEVTVATLASSGDEALANSSTLDPLTEGYAVTGDQNIIHARVVARYRIRDAASWALYGPIADDVMRVEVTAAMTRSLGEMGVDRVLADGRKDLIARATERAQAGLNASHAGLELTSLELIQLAPPTALAGDFTAVQSAFIGAETRRKESQAYAERVIPQAQAQADSMLQSARASADSQLAAARGESAAFLALSREYRANPAVVRERLYRDAVERAISSAGALRWVPPPTGARYDGLRISVPSNGTVPPPVDDEP